MADIKVTTAEKRNYKLKTANDAKELAIQFLVKNNIWRKELKCGLPEINDRYHFWKVPIILNDNDIGELIIDAYTQSIDIQRSSNLDIIQERISRVLAGVSLAKKRKNTTKEFTVSPLSNLVIKGRSEIALKTLPAQSIDLIFTSPPYFNARKQYSEYESYDDYLFAMRKVIHECCRVLIDGKFFVINVSHVLVPRTSRNESSSRIAVPFDLHQIFTEEGFEFVDDIIWQKPEGAGWASGRGRRFSADRNPMQYKTVPVTEYVLVYRKKPCILIDHFIRNNPNQEIIKQSKIADGYEKTNVWYIPPAHDKRHPAIFPPELAEKVIRYYSFVNDVILDPFGGIGTTAKAAIKLNRRFCTIEISDEYITAIRNDLTNLGNNLVPPVDFEYRDLHQMKDDETYISFAGLIHRLLREGYTQEELYKALTMGLHKK